jgi:hypothetical protein
MRYRIVKLDSPDREPWKVSTTGWIYVLKDAAGKEIIEFHWHPAITPMVPFPHLHTPEPSVWRHCPTGRVLIEDVLNLAVECGAEPTDPAKWDDVFRTNVENFGKGATWGDVPLSWVDKPA